MIVYRELSSLCHDLGYSARALYAASNSIFKHYHTVSIPKSNGEQRVLHVPDKYLKSIQKSIARNLLPLEEISIYAKAYRHGGSTGKNAMPHVGAKIVMKCDIRQFFDHITFAMVRAKVFPISRYSEANSILLSILCVYEDSTPQGAPTSPAISNIILRDFDNRVGAWCKEKEITYTRYCDDMTFSGDFDTNEVREFVKKELFKEGFFLNTKKTVVLRDGQRKAVTSLIVNDKLSVPKSYKKELRQSIYYCRKNGVESHLKFNTINETPDAYIRKILGRVNYVLSVEPDNVEMQEYRDWLRNILKNETLH